MPKRISELSEITSINDGELFEVSQDQGDSTYLSKSVSYATIKSEVNKKVFQYFNKDDIDFTQTGTHNLLSVPDDCMYLANTFEIVNCGSVSSNISSLPWVEFGTLQDPDAFVSAAKLDDALGQLYGRQISEAPQGGSLTNTTITMTVVSGATEPFTGCAFTAGFLFSEPIDGPNIPNPVTLAEAAGSLTSGSIITGLSGSTDIHLLENDINTVSIADNGKIYGVDSGSRGFYDIETVLNNNVSGWKSTTSGSITSTISGTTDIHSLENDIITATSGDNGKFYGIEGAAKGFFGIEDALNNNVAGWKSITSGSLTTVTSGATNIHLLENDIATAGAGDNGKIYGVTSSTKGFYDIETILKEISGWSTSSDLVLGAVSGTLVWLQTGTNC
jgi:hypothetical protein